MLSLHSLRDGVTRIYYSHGLFCASHPYSILAVTICTILMSIYPLYKTPLMGSVPVEYGMTLNEFRNFDTKRLPAIERANKYGELRPRWLRAPTVGYVQQIVIKAAVYPWQSEFLVPSDAFRAPLGKVFDILQELDQIRYQDGDTHKSLADLCLRIAEPIGNKMGKGILPEYTCLEVSPGNFWQRDKEKFMKDGEILKTIYKKYDQALDTPPYLRDILLGIPWRLSGISRYFIRNKQRTMTFAVNILLKKYDQKFVEVLREHLEAAFPGSAGNVNNTYVDHVVHVYYRNKSKFFLEYKPLILTYVVLLMYLYFSVRKIEMVKSKWGLALSAVVTIVSSLLMSVSICMVFGLTPTLNGGEIFPYLVVLIGMENVMVITKSVVSTPVDLDVKYRVAQGISKEGWSITKNLATELVIVLCGFFTFVPEIQEFAVFALVGLMTDFFLQIIFFVTTLSIDIRRMELSDLNKHPVSALLSRDRDGISQPEPVFTCPYKALVTPKRNYMKNGPSAQRNSLRGNRSSISTEMDDSVDDVYKHNSKRMRFFYFLANMRMMQRAIMVCTIIWIFLIVYKTGLFEHLSTNMSQTVNISHHHLLPEGMPVNGDFAGVSDVPSQKDEVAWSWAADEHKANRPVEHTDLELWKQLSHNYWPTLFSYYNISIFGRYLTMLPTIHVSSIIDPQEAINIRHHSEQDSSLPAVIPDHLKIPLDVSSQNSKGEHKQEYNAAFDSFSKYYDPERLKQFYPKSFNDLIVTFLLIVLTFVCMSYFLVSLYNLLCPKDYGRRKSKSKQRKKGVYYKQIKESVPKVLSGHTQEIENVVTDAHYIVSSCLGSQLRVWDSVTGDCITVIHRKSAAPPVNRKPCEGRNIEDSDADLYDEYHGSNTPQTKSQNLDRHSRGIALRARHRGESSWQPQPISYSNEFSPTGASQQKKFYLEPDLHGSINTNFHEIPPHTDISYENSRPTEQKIDGSGDSRSQPSSGYDFAHYVGNIYDTHRQQLMENGEMIPGEFPDMRARSWSAGDLPHTLQHDASLFDHGFEDDQAPSIWALTCKDGLIIAGCGSGRVEFWDGSSGALKYMYNDSNVGVTAICFIKNRVIVARLDGSIDFLEVETFHNQEYTVSTSPTKGHSRNFSQSHIQPSNNKFQRGHTRNHSQTLVVAQGYPTKWEDILHVVKINTTKAHQQPIVSIQAEGGRVISASLDYTLKVFKLNECSLLYTLHGHEEKITVLCLDKFPPYSAVSGDSNGCVRLWDLPMGSCIHKVKAHNGGIVSLALTAKYVVSSGLDDCLVIWGRNKGCILHTLDLDPCVNSNLALLSNNLLVTGGQGCIYLVDIQKGEVLRTVNLGDTDRAAFVHQIKVVENTVVVCDCATDMKVIHFPTVLEKME